jgi:hypothetical protein
MSALDELIGTDELREQIVERAAEKALERWRPSGDDKRVFDGMLQARVDEMVKDALSAEMAEPVREAIAQALDGEFQPTDAYGEPRGGSKKTLRELIAARVEKEIKLPENRNGYSSSRQDTALGDWLEREIKEKVKKQLWADFQTIADATTTAAAEAIQGSIAYLVKAKTKR